MYNENKDSQSNDKKITFSTISDFLSCNVQIAIPKNSKFVLGKTFPKKHSLITQKRFWPFFGVFSGFLGVPQNYIFWSFKSVF